MTGSPVGRVLIGHGVLFGAIAVIALTFVLSLVSTPGVGEAIIVAAVAVPPGLCVGYLIKRAALGWAATAPGGDGRLGAGLWRERYDACVLVKKQFDAEVAAMPPGQARDDATTAGAALLADLVELHRIAASGYAADPRAQRYPTKPESQEFSARLNHAEWTFRQSVECARRAKP